MNYTKLHLFDECHVQKYMTALLELSILSECLVNKGRKEGI